MLPAHHHRPKLRRRVRRKLQAFDLVSRDPQLLCRAVPVDFAPIRNVVEQRVVKGCHVVCSYSHRLLHHLFRRVHGGRDEVKRIRLREDHDVIEGVIVVYNMVQVRVAFSSDVGKGYVRAEGGVLNGVVHLGHAAFGVEVGGGGDGRPWVE